MKLVLPLHPTTNQQYGYRGHAKYLTAQSRTWKEEVQWKLRILHPVLLTGKVKVTAHYYLKHDRDLGNDKLLWDTLTGIVYQDDKQIVESHCFKTKDPLNPRVELEIVSL